MYKLSMIDADGFLFCNLTVVGKTRLDRIVAKYKSIKGLTFEVEELR